MEYAGSVINNRKKKYGRIFSEQLSVRILSSRKDHIVVGGDQVAVDSEIKCIGPDEKIHEMYYCDIYELENSKVKKLIADIISKRLQSK